MAHALERVIVVGTSGCGKTLFSRQLAQSPGYPCVELDKNRLELYLLAINEGQPGASHEYRSSVCQAIYRAETAKARGR